MLECGCEPLKMTGGADINTWPLVSRVFPSRPLAQIKCSQISTAESLLCDKVQAFSLSARSKVVFI